MRNYLSNITMFKTYIAEYCYPILLFFCFLFPLTMGSRFVYYDFYFSFQCLLLFFCLLRFKFIKFNISIFALSLIFLLIYSFSLFSYGFGGNENFWMIRPFPPIDMGIFYFCFMVSIINFDKIAIAEKKIFSSIHKPIKVKKNSILHSKDNKSLIISEKDLFYLCLLFIYVILFTFTLEPMQIDIRLGNDASTLNGSIENSVILNARYRINYSDPNMSALIFILTFYILSFNFPKPFFITGIVLIVLVTGSRSAMLLSLILYSLTTFHQIKFRSLIYFYFILIFFVYAFSWFLTDYVALNNINNNDAILNFLKIFCPVNNCRPLQEFIETGPLRIFDIFDISNFHRFNVIGANLHDFSKMNISDYSLPHFDHSKHLLSNSFDSSHELILSMLPRLGLLLVLFILGIIFYVMKKSYFFRFILFPLMLSSIFLGAQFLLLAPLIFLSFFYLYRE